MDGSWWGVLTKCGPLEKGMANYFSILALRTPWTVWEGKKRYETEGWTPQVGRCPICYWRSEEKKEWRESQSNTTQLWMWLVMEVKSNALKSNIALEPGILGPWIKANWKWSNSSCKSKHWHSRNQWTKMDWNGEFNSDDHYIYYCEQESLRRNGVAIMVTKESEMQYLDAISNTTKWSLFVFKANISISQ